MPSGPPGTVETGAPNFVVLGPEALGVSAPPTDLHLLPDGRVVTVTPREIALGDGARWEAFHAGTEETISPQIAVDAEGNLYTGVNGAIARIDFAEDSRWLLTTVARLPASFGNRRPEKVSMLSRNWLWFGDGDIVVSWKPGETPVLSGHTPTFDQIYELHGTTYLSDHSTGKIMVRAPDGTTTPVRSAEVLVSESATCALPFGSGQFLVGTVAAGLKLFDGTSFHEFGQPGGLLRSAHRITDLTTAGDGFYAAGIETVGLVFFDSSGRTVQVLSSALDHRLARPERLRYAANGVLWALLKDGLARVEFPSPVSDFAPLLPGGLTYVQPRRYRGELWVLADGRALRGIYDANRRLDHFVDATPPGRYLFTLSEHDGALFGASDNGIHLRTDEGWKLVLPGIVNARLGVGRGAPGRIYFAARGEYGFIEPRGGTYVATRISAPELSDNFNATIDAAGVGWIELGMNHVARLDPRGERPTLRILGPEDGLPRGWIEAYVLDGTAYFHRGRRVLRYDDASGRIVPDAEILNRYPLLLEAGGRPVVDRFNRLWYTHDRTPELIDLNVPGGKQTIPLPRIGIAPIGYTVEDDGVAWLFASRRLVRIDLRVPSPPATPPRALITSVELIASGRQLSRPAADLGALPWADNSLAIRFAAPANPFSSPVTFEVLLEGAGTRWVSTGIVGSATFNRLKEGDYVFHVRPVVAGAPPGTEARVAFRVKPPWFRTPLAWTIYVLTAAALVAFAAWLSSFLQRRENERLEHLVAARTHELNATNRELERQFVETAEKSTALSASEERYRVLNAELEKRVQDRTAELSRSNRELAHRESLFRLVFENAPVGISWKRADLEDAFHFNRTFLRILSVDPTAPFDRADLFNLVHPEDHPRQMEFTRLLEQGEIDSYQLEQRFVLADGRIVWGSLSVAVIRDDDGRIVQHIGILEDITQRKQAEEQLAETYKNLVATSRVAGMAEVATGVLHNVGNVLNSVNVSANILADGVQQSKTDLLVRLSALVHEHVDDLGTFLTEHPKGRLVPEVLKMIAENAVTHRAWLAGEIASMQKNIDHIKEIVAMQQSYATTAGVVETLEAATLFDDALQMNESALSRHEIEVVREFSPVPRLVVEKGKVLQILTNLIRNAKYACEDAPPPEGKKITLRIEAAGADRIRLLVLDNGVGIAAENLTKIFSHGFTTRAHGHGFGLHSSVLAARDMGGSLQARSAGLGAGATFTLELPIAPRDHTEAPAARAAFPQSIESRATVTRRVAAVAAPGS